MKFVRICSWPVSKVLLINCIMQIKMCLIDHQKIVRQVCIFSEYSVKMTTKLQAYLSVPINQSMHSSQSVLVKILVSMQNVQYTPVIYA